MEMKYSIQLLPSICEALGSISHLRNKNKREIHESEAEIEENGESRGCSSVVQHMLSMHEARFSPAALLGGGMRPGTCCWL